MPLRPNLLRVFHRTLYAGLLETVTLLKRGDDQREGEVVSHVIYQARHSVIVKTWEPILLDMASDHRITWFLPKCELQRVGVNYINVLDRIVDSQNREWQPESQQTIDSNLFENQLVVNCVRRR